MSSFILKNCRYLKGFKDYNLIRKCFQEYEFFNPKPYELGEAEPLEAPFVLPLGRFYFPEEVSVFLSSNEKQRKVYLLKAN